MIKALHVVPVKTVVVLYTKFKKHTTLSEQFSSHRKGQHR